MRLQDLVDKLQLKVKAYKRSAEEAVSVVMFEVKSTRGVVFCLQILRFVSLTLTGRTGQCSSWQVPQDAA